MFEGLVVQSVGFVNFGDLAKRFENKDLKYIAGYVTYFTNGYIMVNGGGSASSEDYITIYLFDNTGKILYQDSETTF
jgi:hypothetical protein